MEFTKYTIPEILMSFKGVDLNSRFMEVLTSKPTSPTLKYFMLDLYEDRVNTSKDAITLLLKCKDEDCTRKIFIRNKNITNPVLINRMFTHMHINDISIIIRAVNGK